MPRIGLEVTQEIALEPRLEQQLRQEFRQLQTVELRIAQQEIQRDKHRARIAALRAESGLKSISLDCGTSTLVEPNRRTFDRRKYVSLGGDLTLYDAAHEVKPGTPYERITLPGEKPTE